MAYKRLIQLTQESILALALPKSASMAYKVT